MAVHRAFPMEREVKLVPPSAGALLRARALVARLGATVGPGRVRVLSDLYLDSADHWLWRAGLGLRLRARDRAPTLTLKAARGPEGAAVLERPELEEPVRKAPAQFPCPPPGTRIAAWIRHVAGPLDLLPVARLTVRRCESDLVLPGGHRATLCADAVLAEAAGHRVRFWEVEIESQGQGGDLERFARRLSEMSGWPIVVESKLERALALADVPPPALEETGLDVRPADACSEAALRVIRRHWNRYVWNEPGTRAGLDPEALHDMRVATRRLRAAWPVFRPCLPAAAEAGFEGLRWIARSMGRVRDLDVQIASLREAGRAVHPRHWPAVEGLASRMERHREVARKALLRALGSRRHRTMTADFDRLLAAGPHGPGGPCAAEPVARIAGGVLRARSRKVFRSLRRVGPATPDDDLHDLRILIKKLRYAIEFFGPVLGKAARKVVSRLAGVQDLLGAHQDAAVMCDLLALAAAARPDDRDAHAAVAALTALYRRRQQEWRAALPEAMSGDLCARIERLASGRG